MQAIHAPTTRKACPPPELAAGPASGPASGPDAGPDDEQSADDPHDDKHIIEQLIEERAKTLVKRPLWPLYRSILFPVLRHRQAIRMADRIADMSGRKALDSVSEALALDVSVTGLEHVPETGRVLIAATHPTGIADGVAMFDALKGKRPDLTFFANRDAIRVVPKFTELMIPVEWVPEKRTRERSRETLRSSRNAFSDGRCVVLFPSGRLAYMDERKNLIEQEWMTSVAILAKKHDCAIVPANVRSRNSWVYYWFRNLNQELRDITLFRELLNKKGKPFDIAFGPPIPPDALKGDPNDVTGALRRHAIEDIRAGRAWSPVEGDVASPTA
ncbi:MAG: acyltransferase [Alphaproteobacteria bacterium]|nr:acyltransferase [Alphaproteobacteria bacterium]